MTIKRKFAYYIIPIVLVCGAAVFIFLTKYQNNPQEPSIMDRYPSQEQTKVVQENKQEQTEDQREKPVADTYNEGNKGEDTTEAAEVVRTDADSKDVDSSTTFVESTRDEDPQQTTSVEVPNTEIWDSEAREIPNLSEVHLRRPHYTKVLDNGTVFDSRKSQETVIPDGAIISGSLEDVKNTILELEKIENKSQGLKIYIEALKRFEHPPF